MWKENSTDLTDNEIQILFMKGLVMHLQNKY